MSPITSPPIPYSQLLENVAHFVQTQWNLETKPGQLFYNPETLQDWVAKAQKIAGKEGLAEDEQYIVELALYFLAYDYMCEEPVTGERAARQYLLERQVPEHEVQRVESLIELIQSNRQPELPLERVLHDAVWSFLGRKRFSERATLLRMERELIEGQEFKDDEWSQELLELCIQHPFYTEYAEKKYGKQRRKNIASLRSSMTKIHANAQKERTGKNIGRGIDTLYRVNFGNHIDLSGIADGKANILISINTILLSIIITVGSTGFSFIEAATKANALAYTPVIVLLCTCVASLVFAVLSTRPKIVEHPLDEQPDATLLFFGNFLQVPKRKFIQYLDELKNDQNRLYQDLGKDLYNLGFILKKKYNLLTISYNVFLFGIVITAMIFLFVQLR